MCQKEKNNKCQKKMKKKTSKNEKKRKKGKENKVRAGVKGEHKICTRTKLVMDEERKKLDNAKERKKLK